MEAAKFLNRQFIFTRGNVPYNTQLVPLAALYAELGKELEPANAQEKLERWFWCGIMGETYGSAVETQFANDLAQVAHQVRGGAEPELLTQSNFVPERLLSLRTRNSAAYKGLYALQMKNGAADWHSGEPLSLADIHTKPIDIHHIFPKHWCQKSLSPRYRMGWSTRLSIRRRLIGTQTRCWEVAPHPSTCPSCGSTSTKRSWSAF